MRLSTLLSIVVAVLAGVVIGLLATISSLDLDSRGIAVGAWRTTPRDGSGHIDPYALAANARAGLLPLGEAEGLSFVARDDDGGATLDGRCTYRLKGPMPPARFWTLSLLDPAGFPVADPARRYGFTSAEVLRLDRQPVTITLAPQAHAGNWLPTGASRSFVLMLRLYDTSLTGGGTDFAALMAGLTHLVAILLLPHVASRDAYDLLAKSGIGHDGMGLLAPARPGDTLLPFRDPAAVQGLCFYDLAKAPVRVRAKVEDGRLLSLSFRTREGRIFYSMTDRAALHGSIDIRLVTPAQLDQVSAGDDEDAGLPEELRLPAPTTTGLLVATAMITRPSERADAEARINAVECKPEPLPPPS